MLVNNRWCNSGNVTMEERLGTPGFECLSIKSYLPTHIEHDSDVQSPEEV